ncbi:MAG: hypothetical protein QF454_04810 [Candidatus Thalassarchaeaceae archaeon]|nr:hypothetical protein [Candidatus Thalassarchaeaceae archaeon]
MWRFMGNTKRSKSSGNDSENVERIPRRDLPYFDEQSEDVGLIGGMTSSGGIFRVAFLDTNQFGPHAMIVMLFGFAAITGGILFLLSL